ncbi:MAG: 4Fe-4S dicluster domain-containing protein [Spirochaetales bacterium]|nr:MAG: 4Fe-4S dicluster domain-containing protein [Spirochaetales bacterium]
MNQLGFYFNQTRCIGCHTCVVACKDWHDHQDGSVNWMRIKTIEKGKYPDLFLAFMAVPCYQCEDPSCMTACPQKAIYKREADGVVMVDWEKCPGKDICAGTPCLKACRTGSPQFGMEANAKMQKCDFCADRLEAGKQPICVEACPMYALEIDTLKKLREKHGERNDATGFVYSKKIKQAVVFTPKPPF